MTAAATTESADPTLVSILIVTYEPDQKLLTECIASVIASTHRPLQLVVVDNGSQRQPVITTIQESIRTSTHPEVEVTFSALNGNRGYAGGTNEGIRLSRGEFVLLLNPDARVESTTVSLLLDAARRRPRVSGFAPKVLLSDPGVVIDSVGLILQQNGVALQRGLGEADVGQYDVETPTQGLCFAAALIRRDAFGHAAVGLLDERYFMFYEDVDWSYRANIVGEDFWAVPDARVFHFHSASTRHLGGGLKARLIQRNLMWTVIKNCEGRAFITVLLRRTAIALRRILGLRHPVASARAIGEAWFALPSILGTRRLVQRRRVRRDRDFLSAHTDPPFFDADRYVPQVSIAALLAVLAHLYAVAPDPVLEATLTRVQRSLSPGPPLDPAHVTAIVRESGLAISPGLGWLLGEIDRLPE